MNEDHQHDDPAVEQARLAFATAQDQHNEAEFRLAEARTALAGVVKKVAAGDTRTASSLANKKAAVDLEEIAEQAAHERADAARGAFRIAVVDFVSRQAVESPELDGSHEAALKAEVVPLIQNALQLSSDLYRARNSVLAASVEAATVAELPTATNDTHSTSVLIQNPLAPVHRLGRGLYFSGTDKQVLPVDVDKQAAQLVWDVFVDVLGPSVVKSLAKSAFKLKGENDR